MNYTKYDSNTGEITSNLVITDAASLAANLPDQNYISGIYKTDEHYIDTNTKTPIAKPAKPSIKHTWNAASKVWELDLASLAMSSRIQRNNLLLAVDLVNPLRYASLTADQQTELQKYRVDLLNVPQQSGFPETITWPTRPSWL
jgi:hypothetical protein